MSDIKAFLKLILLLKKLKLKSVAPDDHDLTFYGTGFSCPNMLIENLPIGIHHVRIVGDLIFIDGLLCAPEDLK